jgi:hypothetical protein
MPQLIKPNDVKVITKDGEVKISLSLDLNINLNQNTVDVDIGSPILNKKQVDDNDKTIWQIPDFSSNEKINFGK